LDRQARTDQSENPDRTEPMLAAEPIENADATEPAEPMDRIEPAEPIDRIEPAEPMLRIEAAEPPELAGPADLAGLVNRVEPRRFRMTSSSPGSTRIST
jgi:hypothetical protein